jgi:putative ABC transport system ATP-binding protein
MRKLLELENVNKVYSQNGLSRKILNNISLSINEGDFISITGKSGSGKSTLLNIIGLIDDLSDGNYFFDNKSVKNLNETELAKFRNTNFGYIFQQYNLISNKSVIENVALPLYYRSVNKNERLNIAKTYLEKLDIGHLAQNYPYSLSGGESQRVAIARALIGNPKIVLADEPTGALDEQNSKLIIDLLKEINTTQGTTILMVTHDMQIAKNIQKSIVIKDGEIKI